MYSPYKAQTIINNCDNYIFGSMDIENCRNVSIWAYKSIEEIMFMQIDEVIVMRRGTKPIFSKRYKIMEDNLYRKVFELDKVDKDVEMTK